MSIDYPIAEQKEAEFNDEHLHLLVRNSKLLLGFYSNDATRCHELDSIAVVSHRIRVRQLYP